MELESTPPKFDKSQPELVIGGIISAGNVVAKLGCGAMSTVWRVCGTEKCVAIKVYGDNMVKHYQNEVRLLEYISAAGGHANIIGYNGVFAHVIMHNSTPYIHPCISMELCANSLSTITRYCVKEFGGGLPRPMIIKIMRDIFSGLAFLHAIGITHGDIKPGNILLTLDIEDIYGPDDIHAKIADVGSGFRKAPKSYTIGTLCYCAPELLTRGDLTPALDIWAAFATCFYLFNGDKLFDVDFRGLDYGSDVDSLDLDMTTIATYDQCATCQQFDTCEICRLCTYCATHAACEESLTGAADVSVHTNISKCKSEYSSGSEDEEMLDYCYMLLVAKVIGYPSAEFADSAPTYYSGGRMINHPDITPTSISQLLILNHEFDPDDSMRIERFLRHGLRYEPELRITAADALGLDFLN